MEAFPIIGRPSNSELELEQLIWEIILEANRLAKHPKTDIKIKRSQKYRRPEIKHFIHSRLIPLILDKKPATDVAFKLYSHIFSEGDGFKYSLALHLNCSSFQKSMNQEDTLLFPRHKLLLDMITLTQKDVSYLRFPAMISSKGLVMPTVFMGSLVSLATQISA